jgi:hypothetical protein
MSTFVLGTTRVRIRQLALSADGTAAIALIALGILGVALTWGTWGDLGSDTGYDLVAATRVAHGQLPYSDFTYYYGPLAPMLLGLVAAIAGGGLGPMIAVGLATSALLVVLTYLLARTFVGAMPAALAAAIVLAVAIAPTNFSYVLPHTAAMTFGMVALLAMLLALARSRPFVAGVCLGITALTKPELALAAVAAAAAWTFASHLRGGQLVRLATPAAALPALVYGAFLTQVSTHRLVFDNLYPTSVLRAGGDKLLRLHAPLTASSLVSHAGHVALYAIGAGALLGASSMRFSHGRARWVLAAIAVVVLMVAFADLEAARSGLQLVYGWIPGGAAIAVVAILLSSRRSPDALAFAVALAVLGATTYAAFYLLSPHAQTAVYFAPLAAVFLAWLHIRVLPRSRGQVLLGMGWLAFLAAVGLALVVKDARTETVVVSGPGGSMRMASANAHAFQGALSAVTRRTRPGEPVLFAPQLSALYVLADRTDPLAQISLLPGALSSAPVERQGIERLKAAHVRVVVTDTHPLTEYGHGSFGVSFDQTLRRWIERNFIAVRTFHGQTHTLIVWRRPSS